MAINRKKFIEKFLKIVNKENELVNIKLNYAQQKLYDTIKEMREQGKPPRIIILKCRQLGLSTGTECIFFSNTMLNFNIKTGIVTHKAEATSNLFNMCKIMFQNLPEVLKPQLLKDNQNTLTFNNEEGTGLNSEIRCMTAGSGEGTGRSSTYTQLHLSEYAFWPGNKKNTYLGLIQTVPHTLDSIVIIESTPNGFDDFKDKWDDAVEGKSDFVALFFPWFDNPEYRIHYDGFELSDEEEELKRLYSLDNEQLAWRRWCIKNNCNNDVDEFKQEYPSNPNECFLSTGNCVFDKTKIANRLQEVKEPNKQGYFEYRYNDKTITDYKFIESKQKNYIKIYEDVKEGYPYVVGGDTAGIGSDKFTGNVINNHTGNQCATLDIDLDEIEYCMQMFCLGMYYNEALICIETNFSSFPVKKLWKMNYTNQYIREVDNGITINHQDKLGFNTNRATKPVIIAELKAFINECINLINSKDLLIQMLYFIKYPDGKLAAQAGYHDDKVMSFAVTLQARNQQSYIVEKKENKEEINIPFALQDEHDDYNNYNNNDFELEW